MAANLQNVAQQHEGTLATAGTPTTKETSTTVVKHQEQKGC
jgi:hypothetical protein